MKIRPWTQYELDIVKNEAPDIGCKAVSEKIGRSIRAVQHKFNELNLEKPKAKIGDIINGWQIIDIYELEKYGQKISYAKVKSTICDKVHDYKLTLLTKGHIGWPDRRRPDVIAKNTTHGLTYHPLYNVYKGMITRCYNKNHISYNDYGSKNIRVCDEWKDDFIKFYDWAINNGWCPGLHIDRIDSSKNYCPENCRIVTPKQNNRNKSSNINLTVFNETKTINDWIDDPRCKCKSNWSIIYRIAKGWSAEKIISTPSRKTKRINIQDELYKFIDQNYPDIMEDFKKSL